MRLKLRSAGKKDSGPTRLVVSGSRDPECRRNFILALENRFNALTADDTNGQYDNTGEEMDKSWFALKAAYSDASREVLGPCQRKNGKEWISAQAYEALRHCGAIRKQKLNAKSPRLQERRTAQYQENNREVKCSTRRDKKASVKEMALKAEEAVRRKDQGELYKIRKTVCRKFHNDSNAPVADKQGRRSKTKDEQNTFRKSSIIQSL